MRVQLNRSRNERGAVAIVVGLLSVVLLGLAAFTTDFGMAYAQRQALYTGTDSAALAIVHHEYESEQSTPRTCQQITASDQSQADSIAAQQINDNAPFGETLPSSAISVDLECVGSNNGVLQATVSVNHTINTLLGHVLGASSMDVNRTSAAGLGAEQDVTGVEPLGICFWQAQQIKAAAEAAGQDASGNYPAQLVTLSKIWQGDHDCSGDGGAGNWGWLDLGQGNGDSALGAMLASGFSGSLTFNGSSFTIDGNPMTGSPGNKGNGNPVDLGMKAIMDKAVWLPVYDKYSGNGSNATYNIVDFISVKICGYDNSVFGGCYDPSVPMHGNDLQVRYLGWATPGEIAPSGVLGDPNSFNAYATKLVQ